MSITILMDPIDSYWTRFKIKIHTLFHINLTYRHKIFNTYSHYNGDTISRLKTKFTRVYVQVPMRPATEKRLTKK